MTPSLKKLQTLGIDSATAREVKQWLQYAAGESGVWTMTASGSHAFEHFHPSERPELIRWKNSLYNMPTRRELAHAAIALILTDGRDSSFEVFQPQEEWTSFTEGPSWEAVNMGDTYTTTLIFRNGRYSVGAWGDITEVNRA